MHSPHPPKISRVARWGSALVATMALSAVSFTGVAAHAAPADELSWSIKPGGAASRTNFSYELEPGDKRKDSFEVTNLGAKDISLSVYAADGITSGSGALDLLPADEPSTVVGAWVKVDQPQITLSPGETENVDFTLAVPKNTEPGDYVGGLISSYVEASGGSTVVVDRRLATRMNVRVGGEGTVALQVQDPTVATTPAWNPFAPVAATVSFTLNNTGTVRARGPYSITTQGPFGIGTTTQSFAADELIPGGNATVVQRIEGIWPLFSLGTKVSIAPEGIDGSPGEPSTAATSGWAVPWAQLVLLLVLVVVAVAVGLRRGRDYDEDEDGDGDGVDEVPVPRTPVDTAPSGRRAAAPREPVEGN
ncbi:WxL protein peptidoglycan domain-containing protein [Paeniglutamicibacter sp. NPDC012692]|uniref:WxL protein peptidoglycan domain-containing protein n=1 Tax=Paeniglutamicibacter sp. NPDC012692 TaxID=3364388 RepID=UPI00369D8D11